MLAMLAFSATLPVNQCGSSWRVSRSTHSWYFDASGADQWFQHQGVSWGHFALTQTTRKFSDPTATAKATNLIQVPPMTSMTFTPPMITTKMVIICYNGYCKEWFIETMIEKIHTNMIKRHDMFKVFNNSCFISLGAGDGSKQLVCRPASTHPRTSSFRQPGAAVLKTHAFRVASGSWFLWTLKDLKVKGMLVFKKWKPYSSVLKTSAWHNNQIGAGDL